MADDVEQRRPGDAWCLLYDPTLVHVSYPVDGGRSEGDEVSSFCGDFWTVVCADLSGTFIDYDDAVVHESDRIEMARLCSA